MSHTLLDVSRLTNNDVAVGLIEENLAFAPEVNAFLSRVIPGTNYRTAVASGTPTTSFTAANEGVTKARSVLEQRLVECFILRGAVEMDKAVSVASQGLSIEDLEMIEAMRVTKSALLTIGSQIWYGTSASAKGFAGIKDFVPKTAAAGKSEIFVDATGTTGATASSMYAVKFGLQDAHLVWGNNQTLSLSEFRDQQLTDGSGGKYAGRVAELTAWAGLQIGNVNCVGRIGNLTADSGKGLTDSLISQLLEKFPVGYAPDALFMSRRSAGQLSRSRSVTIFSMAGVAPGNNRTTANIAPPVPDYYGIPIVVTDSILNTDAIE